MLPQEGKLNFFEGGINAINNGKFQIEKLAIQLTESKMFLSMVIHDMRGPTVSIKLGLQSALGLIQSMTTIINGQLLFCDQCKILQGYIQPVND